MATTANNNQQRATVRVRSTSTVSSSLSRTSLTTSNNTILDSTSSTEEISLTNTSSKKISNITRSTIKSTNLQNSLSKLGLSGGGGGGAGSDIDENNIISSVSSPIINSNNSVLSGINNLKKQQRQQQQQQQQVSYIETDEDIASIAKQISDHAEVIYQTWKARGLAPTEILNCHTSSSEATFGKVLTPPTTPSSSTSTLSSSPLSSTFRNRLVESPVVEILTNAPNMSNNNLEKLVSSFVNEDKARQQAARRNSGGTTGAGSILTSGTIKDALKRFESNSVPAGYIRPNFVINKNASSSSPSSSFSGGSNSSPMSKSATTLSNNSHSQKLESPTSLKQSLGGSSSSVNEGQSQILEKRKEVNSSSPVSNLSKSMPDVLIDSIQSANQMPKNNIINKTQPSGTAVTSPGGTLSTPKSSNYITNSNISRSSNSNHNNIAISSASNNSTDSNLSNNIVTSVNSNSSNNKINSVSSPITTSISTSTLRSSKPQTPAKPANLINHTPSWPLKARVGSVSPQNVATSVRPATTTAATAAISTTSTSASLTNSTSSSILSNCSSSDEIKTFKNSSSALSNCNSISNSTKNNDIKDTRDSPMKDNKKIGAIAASGETGNQKKSADLLDEVSREEERLINALRTGVVLNSSSSNIISSDDNNEKLPEVIISTFNNSNKNLKKISLSSSPSSNISVAQKGLKDSSPSFLYPTGKATSEKTSSGSVIINKTSNNNKNSNNNNINIDISNNSKLWNDKNDITSKLNSSGTSTVNFSSRNISTVEKIPSTSSSSPSSTVLSQGLKLNQTSTTATDIEKNPSLSTVAQNLQKLEAMSPAAPPGLALGPGKLKLRPKNDAAVPHPDTKNSNSHINNLNSYRSNINNPVRPFLTRGSVAERVLMFEKCPDVKAPLRNINREPPKVTVKPLIKPEPPPSHTTLQRHIKSSSKNIYIPKFYFPHGKPLPTIALETTLQRLKSAFDSFPNNQVSKEDLPQILKICGISFYWRMPLIACTQNATSGLVDGYRFIDFWKQMSVYCHDTASRFVYILSRGQRSRPYILHEDLAPLVQDVVDTHPGLVFLKEATEFHSRYVHTVIARIFYTVNRSWSGKITVPELKRSNLLQVIQLLEEEEDINQIMAFFSYEHFYVIYCKFWELDRDHDLFIDQNDLARHNDHALSMRIIERIFSGCVTRGGRARIMGPNGPKMSYTDFVWFLLSEEDKTHPTAIEYWFRCMDLDGDGILSMYELEYFYEEQQQRMEAFGIETLPFEDCLCQMFDMIKPATPGCITLGDLKRCRMTPIFFDTFFNLEKYLEHEQRDPFATQRDSEDGMSDWDRYAAQEYELLVAEEGGDTQGSYDEEEDDYESNIDILDSQLDDMTNILNEW